MIKKHILCSKGGCSKINWYVLKVMLRPCPLGYKLERGISLKSITLKLPWIFTFFKGWPWKYLESKNLIYPWYLHLGLENDALEVALNFKDFQGWTLKNLDYLSPIFLCLDIELKIQKFYQGPWISLILPPLVTNKSQWRQNISR